MMKRDMPFISMFVFTSVIACHSVKFSADNGNIGAQVQRTQTPAITPTMTPQVSTPVSSIPDECKNTLSSQGVVQPSTHQTYRLLNAELAYDEGVAGCKSLNPNGKLIYQGQDLPDEILACRNALGTLWMRPSNGANLMLWQPTGGGAEDPSARHWIICYY